MRPVYRVVDDGLEIPVGRAVVTLAVKHDRVCGHIMRGDGFEPESLAAWAEIVEPKTLAIDVGAYTGLYAIAAAKLGARVVAFEPMPELHRRMRSNIERNWVNVDLYQAAVGNTDGEGSIRFSPAVMFTSGASLLRKGGGQHRVRVVTLDSLFCHPQRVSAIKIDVERAEGLVIRGAAGMIDMHRPKMIVECLDPDQRREVERLLPAYRVAAVMDVRNVLMEPR